MADVTPAKQNIQQEEVDFKSAVSEQMLTKVAGSVNFVNDKQMCTFKFDFLGPFKPISGSEDGRITFINDVEICGFSTSLRDTGSSGVTKIDLHKINAAGADQGSIFQLFHTYEIPSSNTNEAGFFRNFIDGTSAFPTGTFSGTRGDIPDANRLFNAGETLTVDLVTNATDAKDLSVTVFYRPR